MKGISLVGHEEVPHGFTLRTGDHGSYMADCAEDCRRPAQLSRDYWEDPGVSLSCRLLFLFLRCGTPVPLLGKVGKAGLCVCVCVCVCVLKRLYGDIPNIKPV